MATDETETEPTTSEPLQTMARKLIVNAGVKVKREINPTTGTSSAVFER